MRAPRGGLTPGAVGRAQHLCMARRKVEGDDGGFGSARARLGHGQVRHAPQHAAAPHRGLRQKLERHAAVVHSGQVQAVLCRGELQVQVRVLSSLPLLLSGLLLLLLRGGFGKCALAEQQLSVSLVASAVAAVVINGIEGAHEGAGTAVADGVGREVKQAEAAILPQRPAQDEASDEGDLVAT